MSVTRWTTALIVGIVACAGNKPESAVPRADLFGTWQLDRAAGDSLGPAPDTAADVGARPGGRGGPGGMRRPGGMGGRIPGPGGRPEVLGGGMEEIAELRRAVQKVSTTALVSGSRSSRTARN